MDGLLNASGQQLPNNHFVDAQVKSAMVFAIYEISAKHKISGIYADIRDIL
jgi:hypothetical protein